MAILRVAKMPKDLQNEYVLKIVKHIFLICVILYGLIYISLLHDSYCIINCVKTVFIIIVCRIVFANFTKSLKRNSCESFSNAPAAISILVTATPNHL
jgi:hypothetical protein